KPLLRPRLLDDVEGFEKPLAAFRIRHAIGHVAARVAAAADSEQQAAVADLVDGGGLFGEAQRVVQWQDLDPGADLDAFGAGGNRAGDGHRRAHYRAAGLLVNLGEPDRVEPPPVRGLDLPQRFRERLRRGLVRPAMEFMVDADLPSAP